MLTEQARYAWFGIELFQWLSESPPEFADGFHRPTDVIPKQLARPVITKNAGNLALLLGGPVCSKDYSSASSGTSLPADTFCGGPAFPGVTPSTDIGQSEIGKHDPKRTWRSLLDYLVGASGLWPAAQFMRMA